MIVSISNKTRYFGIYGLFLYFEIVYSYFCTCIQIEHNSSNSIN